MSEPKFGCVSDVTGVMVSDAGPVVVVLASGAAIAFDKMPAFLSVEDMQKIWDTDDERAVDALVQAHLEKR